MGFGAIIATALGLVLIIMTAYIVLGGTYSLSISMAESIKKIHEKKNEQLRTSIRIDSGSKSGIYVYLNLMNTGSSKIREFQMMDVIVANTSTKNSSYLKYKNGVLSQEEWNLTILYKDHINPGMADPGEGMNLTLRTTSNPNIVWVATPNGIVASAHLE
ncbi:MAG: hypothetical protein KKD69_02155 [Euryarchaeota archaeon]|nr:hypothetical protein [Euryarchaeota archaeon]MCG2728265.1 hypothetical protein [Candidatus Methanoperedenaceae archaeon]